MDTRITTDLSEMDLDAIHGFISQSYWAKDIPKDLFVRGLENSLCFGMLDDAGKQIAFGRLITDRATFAYLADVFVVEEYRGQWLGKKLLEEVFRHEDLQGLRRITLATRDAHGLYEQFGFTPLNKPDYFMEIWDPDIYQKS